MICSVVVIDRASDASGNSIDGRAFDRAAELAAADGDDAAAPAEFVFLRRERQRIVGLILRDVGEPARFGIERELVAVARVGDRLGALHDVQPEIERVAAEDVAHVVAADDHHLETGFLGDALQASRAHLARRTDGEPIAGDDESLAAMHARAKVGHQVAERSGLPPLVQRFQAFGDAVGRRGDLIGIDGVEFPAVSGAGELRIPEDQRLPADQPRSRDARSGQSRREIGQCHARPATLLDGLCAFLTDLSVTQMALIYSAGSRR